MRYSIVATALLLALSQASSLHAAQSYGVDNAKQPDTSSWACDLCQSEVLTGYFEVGLGYGDNGGSTRFNNWVPMPFNSGPTAVLSGLVEHNLDNGAYQKFTAKDVGLERFALSAELGYYDGIRAKVWFKAQPHYVNDSALSGYQPSNDALVLGTQLQQFQRQVVRDTVGLSLAYTPDSPWQPLAQISHQKKEGRHHFYLRNIPGVGFVPGLIQKDVDSETVKSQLGLQYQGAALFGEISYQGSYFKNNKQGLFYGDSNYPKANHFGYEPDNQLHLISLISNYQTGGQILGARLRYQILRSEGELDQFPLSPILQSTFEGRVDTVDLQLNYANRLSKSLNIKAKVDHSNRNDNSDKRALVGVERTEYDRAQTKASTELSYRINRSLKWNNGYRYRLDNREYATRKETQDHRLHTELRYRPDSIWFANAKLLKSWRSGSSWQYRDTMRLQYYHLADRERTQARLNGGVDLGLNWQLLGDAWLSDDVYPIADISLSHARDYGGDVSLQWNISENSSSYLSYNRQYMLATMHHSYQTGQVIARHQSELDDVIDTLGWGINVKGWLDKRLDISLDYTYHRGVGQTKVNNGISDYPDNQATTHRGELTAHYRLTEQQQLGLNARYEKFSETDYLFTQEQANMGHLEQHYRGSYLFVSWQYLFK